jgi:serine/threonine protein phosphatase PrpC
MSEFAPRGNLSVSFGEACDRGKVREENQDSIRSAAIPLGDLFIVADGIGGYQGGATASRMVVDGFHAQLALRPAGYAPEKALAEASSHTNGSIFATASSGDPATQRMGSTVVLALIQAGNPAAGNSGTLQSFTPTAWIGHVGDSRAYLIRNGKMSKITSDHSAVQALISRNLITEEEARSHPDASVLTRSLGHRPDVEIEIDRVSIQHGDALLLCSDGLWGYVSDGDIAAVATDASLGVQTIADTLLHQALAAGGQDNIGIEFIRVHGDPSLTLPDSAIVGALLSPATSQASPGWKVEPEQSDARPQNKSHLLQVVAATLLLIAAAGYLAIAYRSHHWPFPATSPAQDPKISPVPPSNSNAGHGPVLTPSQSTNSNQRKPRTASAPQATRDHAQGPAAQDDTPNQVNQSDNTAVASGTSHSEAGTATSKAPPPPEDSPGGKGTKRIGVFGDSPPVRHAPPAVGELDYHVVRISREAYPECASFARTKPQVFAHGTGLLGLILKHKTEFHLPGSSKDVETHDLTQDVIAACGAGYDIIMVMPAKP